MRKNSPSIARPALLGIQLSPSFVELQAPKSDRYVEQEEMICLMR